MEWRATEDLLAQERAPICLHAAGVRLGSASVLLVGEAGSGKSTLAAALFERGHSLWGDDLVRFAPREGVFSAFPRSLKLDNKSLSCLHLIPGLCSKATIGTFLAPDCWYVSPAAIRRAVQGGAAIAWVGSDERFQVMPGALFPWTGGACTIPGGTPRDPSE